MRCVRTQTRKRHKMTMWTGTYSCESDTPPIRRVMHRKYHNNFSLKYKILFTRKNCTGAVCPRMTTIKFHVMQPLHGKAHQQFGRIVRLLLFGLIYCVKRTLVCHDQKSIICALIPLGRCSLTTNNNTIK